MDHREGRRGRAFRMHHGRGGPPEAARHPGAGQGGSGHGTGRVVLVIGDEPNIFEAIRFILRRDGWTVETHAEGLDAVERIEALVPDLVILDVMLPGRSGFDILQAMRAREGLREVPVLMLTAKGHTADRDMAMRAGA